MENDPFQRKTSLYPEIRYRYSLCSLEPVSIGKVYLARVAARVPFYPAFFKAMYNFHSRGTCAGDFQCIAACFATFVRINLNI